MGHLAIFAMKKMKLKSAYNGFETFQNTGDSR